MMYLDNIVKTLKKQSEERHLKKRTRRFKRKLKKSELLKERLQKMLV